MNNECGPGRGFSAPRAIAIIIAGAIIAGVIISRAVSSKQLSVAISVNLVLLPLDYDIDHFILSFHDKNYFLAARESLSLQLVRFNVFLRAKSATNVMPRIINSMTDPASPVDSGCDS